MRSAEEYCENPIFFKENPNPERASIGSDALP